MKFNIKQIKQINARVLSSEKEMSSYRLIDIHCHSSSGMRRSFCAPEEIPKLMKLCLNKLNDDLKRISNFEQLVDGIATFWLGFVVTIHPFEDGNGRTGKDIVNQILANFNINPICSQKIPQTRLVGKFSEDKVRLIKLFKYVILSQKLILRPENYKKPRGQIEASAK